MTPTHPQHFIGKANTVAKVLFHKANAFIEFNNLSPLDRRYLLLGEPGTGKTSLAMAVAAHITGSTVERVLNRNATNVEWHNGQSVSIETVRRWRESGQYRPMYGTRIVQIVDEIDGISQAAANEALSYLDSLPSHILFIATTNKTVKDLPERLQSRFKVHLFTKVPVDSIAGWLGDLYGLDRSTALGLAKESDGNVRAAETATLSHIETKEAEMYAQA